MHTDLKVLETGNFILKETIEAKGTGGEMVSETVTLMTNKGDSG